MKKEGVWISYISMVFCILMGLYKMFLYKNPELSFEKSTNVYVGGDAYNYIINANYATSWFVLAGVCAIVGLTFIVVGYLGENATELEPEVEVLESGEINE